MDNTDLIKELRENFALLKPGISADSTGELLRSISREINRLNVEDKSMNLHLKKISADLMSAYTSEVQFQELKNKSENPGLKVKPEFEESFFKSIAILRAELFALLEKL